MFKEFFIILFVSEKGLYTQGKYCNNLATGVILLFIVSKSSVGEIILITVLSHFSKNPVA